MTEVQMSSPVDEFLPEGVKWYLVPFYWAMQVIGLAIAVVALLAVGVIGAIVYFGWVAWASILGKKEDELDWESERNDLREGGCWDEEGEGREAVGGGREGE